MYRIQMDSYVPVPKPATTDRIVAAHYFPFWQKEAPKEEPGIRPELPRVNRATGFDLLHDWPEDTPLMGYYDGDSPYFVDWEIKWALEHGVNCFIYCWYRNPGNVGSPVTVSDLRLGTALHKGLFHARYRDMMNFAIMYESQSTPTSREDMLGNLMPFWLDNYLTKPNYLKIDGKPVLFVYDYRHKTRDSFASFADQRDCFEACREMARQRGLKDLIIAAEYRMDDLADIEEYKACGYDFVFSYCWDWTKPHPDDDYVVDEQIRKMRYRADRIPEYFTCTASCMWDPAPRFVSSPGQYNDTSFPSLWKIAPESFREVIRRAKDIADSLPEGAVGRKLFMLDNWNEWDEGHFLLPSLEFGFGYLQAVREELTARDNLPDYRLPDAIGCGPINTMWDEPDLTGKPVHLKKTKKRE